MYTTAFIRATLERAVKTAAQSALLVIGADQFNALTFDWVNLAGFAAGGFALSVLTSFGSDLLTEGSGPSAVDAEVLSE